MEDAFSIFYRVQTIHSADVFSSTVYYNNDFPVIISRNMGVKGFAPLPPQLITFNYHYGEDL